MSHSPDLITFRNVQYSISRRSRGAKRLDIQTLIKVDGGSNPNSLFFLELDFFHSTPCKADTISLQRRCQRDHSKYP